MKSKITLIIGVALLLVATSIKANHVSAGEITYEYIGNTVSPPNPNLYKVRLFLDNDSAAVVLTQTIVIYSSCSASQNLTVNLVSANGTPIISSTGCLSTGNSFYKPMNRYVYEGTVSLPSTCNDWTFTFDVCCITNEVTTFPSGPTLGLTTTLNNMLGPNSTPVFTGNTTHFICVDNFYNLPQGAIEPDGDSLFYDYGVSSSGYLTPYSSTNPMTTNSSQPFTINAAKGGISFFPTMQEVTVFHVRVNEYKTDSVNNIWLQVATTTRSYLVYISSTCAANITDSISFVSNSTTVGGLPSTTAMCGDTSMTFTLVGSQLDCSSITASASEFHLYNPFSSTTIPITSAQTNCTGFSDSLEVTLQLGQALSQAGSYVLTSSIGTDGNIVVNQCGMSVASLDSFIVKINSPCNIGLAENSLEEVNIYPNPSTGSFTIDYDFSAYELLDITITDLLGRTVYSKEGITERTTINTGLIDGIYMMIIKSPKKGFISTQKLFVEK